MIATYVAATKEFLNSESVNSSTFAKRLRDIIAEHLVELNTAASTVDLGTTSLVSFRSPYPWFPPAHLATIDFFYLHYLTDFRGVADARFLSGPV